MAKTWRTYFPSFVLIVTIPVGFLACHPASNRSELPKKTFVPAGLAIRGQRAILEESFLHRTFAIPIKEATVELGMGFRTNAMTFSGTMPGPVIESSEGDLITLNVPNQGEAAHGLDTHAFLIDAAQYGPVAAGKTLTITRPVTIPGVFMYHCAAGPVTDFHMKAGMYGAMIVYPKKLLRPAIELVVVESALYAKPDAHGMIIQDATNTATNQPFTMMFNGTLEHQPIHVPVGQLVRLYFVNVGPGDAAVHVIGTILDRFYASGNPQNVLENVQTASVPPGAGAIIEFPIPEKGTFLFVDHDNLRFLPYGLALSFVSP
jgi:nitrite reductase (NO-forming)